MWGATESERQIANELQKLLPKVDPNKPVEWEDSPWNPRNQPTLEEMTNSLVGQQTLAMFASCPKIGEGADDPKLDASAPELPATDAQAPQDKPVPEPVAETPNEYMAKLNWPPRPSPPPPKPPEADDTPHKWQAARPSTPDTSLRPLAADDYSNNSPIY
jgi:hypothetical protein